MLLRPQPPQKGGAAVLAVSAALLASGANGPGWTADQHGLWACPTITSRAFMKAAVVGVGCSAPPEGTEFALCATARSANDELISKHFRSATVLG